MATVILGISSSISLYKSLELISLLNKSGHKVIPVPTYSAQQLINKELFEYLSGNPVPTESTHHYNGAQPVGITHIEVAKMGDILVIAPATAHLISNMASGNSNSMLMDIFLAFKGKVMVFPAMNTAMWENQATQANICVLKQRGIEVIDPDHGLLACKDVGIGKLKLPEEMFERIERYLQHNIGTQQNDIPTLKVLITLGSSIEPLDPVRVITNLSSGKMGVALSKEWAKRGAQVTVIYGNISQALPMGINRSIPFTYNEDLLETINQELSTENYDVFMMAAAPCDFELKEKNAQKIKKTETLILELKKKKDLLQNIVRPKNTTIVGFAAETEKLYEHALYKLKSKNLNMIIANTAYSQGQAEVGIGLDKTEYGLIDDKEMNHFKLAVETKNNAALKIVDAILKYIKNKD